MTELERIIEVYGEDIEDRAHKVESRMIAPVGEYGFGYRVAHWEDIQQRAYETLLINGVTLEDIQAHPEPLGYLYEMCLNKGIGEAKKARAFGKDYILTAFSVDDADDPFSWIGEQEHSQTPGPQAALMAQEFDKELREAVLTIIAQTGEYGIEVLELWVFQGYTAREVSEALGASYEAVRVRIHRGLQKLSDDDRAALHAARTYLNPTVKRPKGLEAEGNSLMGLLKT